MPHLPHLKSFLLASVLTALTLSPARAKEKFKVITTFTVIADMASNVAGDAADVSSITKPGAEIHEYQPTPGILNGRKAHSLFSPTALISNYGLPASTKICPAYRRSWSQMACSQWVSAKGRTTANRIRMLDVSGERAYLRG